MKKFLLSILVGTASYAGAYASNEIITDENCKVLDFEIKTIELEYYKNDNVEFFDDCFYSVIYTTSWGELRSVEMMTLGTRGSYTSCIEAVNEKLDDLRSWNYTIHSYSISYGNHW